MGPRDAARARGRASTRPRRALTATPPPRADERAGVFADLLAGYCLAIAPGQQVLVRSTSLAAPLLLELQRAVLERAAWPVLRIAVPGQEEGFLAHAGDAQLDAVAPLELEEARAAEALLTIQAPDNTRALAGVAPARLVRAARAREPLLQAAMDMTRCVTLWPTAALAQQAGMGLSDYAALLGRALFLDRPDPAASWRQLAAAQTGLIGRLAPAHVLHLQAEGTDLRLEVAGRQWINSDGRRNMPSGEVFTGPVEESAEGTVRFDIATSPRAVEISGVELTFQRGKVVHARAARGQDHLEATLATDPGARYLGELGVGTNTAIDRPTGSILLDEKIGGTVHLALGRSYPETGGLNQSAVHWDLIGDLRRGGRLTADGDDIIVDGEFV